MSLFLQLTLERDLVQTLTNDQFWKLWDTCFLVRDGEPVTRRRAGVIYTYDESDEWQVEVVSTSSIRTVTLSHNTKQRVQISREIDRRISRWPEATFTFSVRINDRAIDRLVTQGTSSPRKRWFCRETLQQIALVLPDFILKSI